MTVDHYPRCLGGGPVEDTPPAPRVAQAVIEAAEEVDQKRPWAAVRALLAGKAIPERWADEIRIAQQARTIIENETGVKKWIPKNKQKKS